MTFKILKTLAFAFVMPVLAHAACESNLISPDLSPLEAQSLLARWKDLPPLLTQLAEAGRSSADLGTFVSFCFQRAKPEKKLSMIALESDWVSRRIPEYAERLLKSEKPRGVARALPTLSAEEKVRGEMQLAVRHYQLKLNAEQNHLFEALIHAGENFLLVWHEGLERSKGTGSAKKSRYNRVRYGSLANRPLHPDDNRLMKIESEMLEAYRQLPKTFTRPRRNIGLGQKFKGEPIYHNRFTAYDYAVYVVTKLPASRPELRLAFEKEARISEGPYPNRSPFPEGDPTAELVDENKAPLYRAVRYFD